MPTIRVAPVPPVTAASTDDSLRSPSLTVSSARDGPKKKLTASAVATAQRLVAPVLQSAHERSDIAAFVVWCSPRTFRVLWCVILLLHVLNIGIVARSLYSWIRTERDPEEVAKALRNVGMRFSHSTMRGIIISGGVALSWHCVYVWRAISNSIRHRQLVFDRLPSEPEEDKKAKETHSRPSMVQTAIFQSTRHLLQQLERIKSVGDSVTSFLDSRSQRSASSWLRVVWTPVFLAWKALNACVSAFGIRGQYFDVGFHLRELFEISVQTYQAYKINYLVPQDWVSFLSLCVVVLNCWTTPLLHAIIHRDMRLRRVWCLGVDVGLDFFSSMLLPFLVYAAYRRLIVQADWYNPVWIMQTANALLCFHANSPLDLVARVLPNLSMLSCLGAIQPLLRAQSPHSNTDAVKNGNDPVPLASPASKTATDSNLHPQQQQQHRRQRRLHQLLMVHGLAVIVLQVAAKLQAETHPVVGCQLATKRWFATKSTCAVLELNCHRRNWTGAAQELDSVLTRVDEQALAALIVSHCPSAELSRSLHWFPNLVWLEVFNSTLVDWPSRAAPSNAHNPRLSRVLMVRTNFTNGFPAALLSMDSKDDPNEEFPTTLIDIEFVATNLTALPADVGYLWPDALSTFLVESSMLSAVPPALGFLDVDILSLAGNNITTLPVELANGTDFLLLSLANNPLQSLPDVPALMPLWRVQTLALDQTRVQRIPIPHDQPSVISTIIASGAPVCDGESMQSTPTNLVCDRRVLSSGFVFPLAEHDARRVL
ncbi:hypothetical protein PINS_up004369 [Pythium insidiosum]|nr:hypothetical protein PINS_up004369 [Pythium insidiosum]